jgi:hypothetical protein
VLALEQCYRGSQTLLAAANALGARLRYGHRQLWTANPSGPPIVVLATSDPTAEARAIVAEVRRLLSAGALRSAADCAVLYRTNGRARELELACIAAGLPYRVRARRRCSGERRCATCSTTCACSATGAAAPPAPTSSTRQATGGPRPSPSRGDPLDLDVWACVPCTFWTGAQRGLRSSGDDGRAAGCRWPACRAARARYSNAWDPRLLPRRLMATALAQLRVLRVLAERSGPPISPVSRRHQPRIGRERGALTEALAFRPFTRRRGRWPVVFVAGVEEGLLPPARWTGRPRT